MITVTDALILGVVEGLTEFLPVSSTGHLTLVTHGMFAVRGISTASEEGQALKAAYDTFNIVIQLGALVAVLGYYQAKVRETVVGLVRRDRKAINLTLALALGFLPAALAGLTLGKVIKAKLFGVGPVAAALAVGGVVMIVVELVQRRRAARAAAAAGGGGAEPLVPPDSIDDVTPLRGLLIGLAQCAALWPGMSRSMSTIVGGQLVGLSTATAAQFSFLLALPTLGAATLYDFYKHGGEILKASGGALPLLVGLATAGLTAWVVVRGMIGWLTRLGMAPFGVYRILLAVVLYLWVVRGA